MLEWLKKRASIVHKVPKEAPVQVRVPARQNYSRAGKYRTLYEYLEKRYANTVVLTFGQLEDLLGFPLPDQARTDPAWWSTADISDAELRCSDAWNLAGRTAQPNLMAQTVAFERP